MIYTVQGFSIVDEAEVDFFFLIFLLSLWSSECWEFDLGMVKFKQKQQLILLLQGSGVEPWEEN